MMKRYSIPILALLLTGSFSLKAQSSKSADGLYLKPEDFKNQDVKERLAPGDRLQINSFFGGSDIKLVRKGQNTTFAKSDLFGYRFKGKDYRFFKDGEYEIADTVGFYLYKRKELTAGRKGQVPQTVYYFSKSAESELVRLTIGNLNKAYQEQDKFRYALMDFFKTDAQLTSYDPQLKMYQLKYIYSQHAKSMLSK